MRAAPPPTALSRLAEPSLWGHGASLSPSSPGNTLTDLPRAMGRFLPLCLLVWVLAGPVASLTAQDRPTPTDTRQELFSLSELRDAFLSGQYEAVIDGAAAAIRAGARAEDWPLLAAAAATRLGRHQEALEILAEALAQDRRSLRLRWALYQADQTLGRTEEASSTFQQLQGLLRTRAWAYRDPAELVVLGQVALKMGVDPREVLERILEPAARLGPDRPEPYLARGQLALDKQDGRLAARIFEEAVQRFPKDPDMHLGLARAHERSDRARMIASIEAALEQNPRHVPSLLLLADHRLQLEDMEGMETLLAQVDAIHPLHPEAWALRAVKAHLRNDPDAEALARQTALTFPPMQPGVDHWIGLRLSQKYRFREGAEYQRRALGMDPAFLPAQAQLAVDLLRLGQLEEGWKRIRAVHDADPYDVSAYNLVTLQDTLQTHITRATPHFILRMPAREANLYGDRVLRLLDRARATLTEKYGFHPATPTTVEIFSEQKDFGVRTFGMPDNPGYLGVCFGSVITANSPSTRPGQEVNWEAVLWHEYAHVITLQATGNKLPRWVSEGISVYEERQADPAWGQPMQPRYREAILKGELSSISRMSAAFLTPRSDFHLQLAYFQAGLVMEYLVETHGFPVILDLLDRLRQGTIIQVALEECVGSLDTLEADFARYARDRAENWGGSLDWERPPQGIAADAQRVWMESRTNNYFALQWQADQAIRSERWEDALPPLRRLADALPEFGGGSSPHKALAAVYRALGDTDAETAALRVHATWTADATDTYQRLMDLGMEAGDPWMVIDNARRFLAVNPLLPVGYRPLADALESLEHWGEASEAVRAQLQLKPANPALVRFRLARLLDRQGDPQAQAHLVMALADAPRHPEGLQLLLDRHRRALPGPGAPDPANPYTPLQPHSP